jgi:hypothetical protein
VQLVRAAADKAMGPLVQFLGGGGDQFGQWLPDPVGDGDLITKGNAHVDAVPGRVVELLLQIPLAGRVREEGNHASGKPARPRPSLT